MEGGPHTEVPAEALVEAPAQDLQTTEDQVAEALAAGPPAMGAAEALAEDQVAEDPQGPPVVDIPDLPDQEVPLAAGEEVILRGGLRGRPPLLLPLLGEEELWAYMLRIQTG